jgi:hypothetical protein
MDIRYGLYVKWSPDDNDYTDETAYLLSAEGQANLTDPTSRISGGRGMIGRTSLVLDNASGRFSIDNAGSPLASKLSGWKFYMAPGYLTVSVDGGTTYDNVASFLLSAPTESIATWADHPAVTFDCYDRAYWLMQAFDTTGLYSAWWDGDADRWRQYREDELVAAMLTRAGLVDGTDFVSQAWHRAYPNMLATLEPGMVPVPWFWLDNESPWDELQRLAGACLGYFLHTPGSPSSPQGWLRYWNMAHWLTALAGSPQLTLYTGNTADMVPRWDPNELYSKVSTTVSPRAAGAIRDIWQASELPYLRPGETTHIVAQFGAPAYAVYALVKDTDYYAASTTGVNLTNSIVVSNWVQQAQRVEFDLTNSHASRSAQFYRLQLRGRTLEAGEEYTTDAESDLTYWTAGLRPQRMREVTNNAYIQHRTHGETISQVLLSASEVMRFRAHVTLAGSAHPRRRLGDVVRLVNARSGWDVNCILTGLSWRLAAGMFQQDIEIVDARAFYPRSEFFTCGRHALGAAPPPPGEAESSETTPTAALFW